MYTKVDPVRASKNGVSVVKQWAEGNFGAPFDDDAVRGQMSSAGGRM